MAATAAAGVHHRAVDGTAVARRRGLHEGTARWCTKGCVTKVGRGWPPEPATRNSGTPRVGQEGGKKSDKTMERNLNYAPRKMAIVCKAMLIRRRRKRGRAPTSQTLPDAEPSFLLLAAGIVSSSVPSFFSLFLPSLSSTVPTNLILCSHVAFYAPCAPFRLLHLSAYFLKRSSRSPSSLAIYLFALYYCTYLVRSP